MMNLPARLRGSWRDFYSQSTRFKVFALDVTGHIYYILSILARLPKSALEVGSGTGFHSCFISYFGVNVVALDIDREVIELSRRNIKRFGGKASFVVASAFNLPFKDECFDVCFSQGLLEHFDDNFVCRFLEGLIRLGRSITLSVPSNYYPLKEFGDERLLAPTSWSELISKFNLLPYGGINVRARYYLSLNVLGRKSIPKLIGPYHVIINVYRRSSKRKTGTRKN
ncbi:MAG TPA: class I SAM-dependent methyltransferase [Candidatus Bathyarchaeia archaeon]|nr:class I SAM-dependent methyltransferase [Candidatus Bathyarchaeia archaeon]